MKLRMQVLIGILALGAIVVGVLFRLVIPHVRNSFEELEDKDVLAHVARTENAIRAELTALESTADDWGAWSDTAAFVRGEAPKYVEANLTDAIFENLRLSFMVFYDVSGRLVLARGFDLDSGAAVGPAPDVVDGVGRALTSLRPADETESSVRLLDLGGRYGLVAFHPVLNSQHAPPSEGVVVVGRVLTPREVARLAAQVELPLDIRPLSAETIPAGVVEALSGATGSVAWHRGTKEVEGYGLWMATGGAPAVLSFAIPRTMFEAGQRTLRYLTGALLALLGALGTAFLVFLNSRVLARTARLSRDVSRISVSNDRAERVSVTGKDELADLGTHVNGMLASIEKSSSALERSEKRYRNLFASSPDPIYITSIDGAFVDVNKAFVELFGYAKEEIMALPAGALYVHTEDRRAFRAAIENEGFVAGYPLTLRRKDGAHLRCLLTSIVEDSPDGTGRVYQGILRDVTELLRQQEKLEYLATHDPLTGLLTRGALDEVMKLEVARAVRNLERLAVFYLDLDKFKEVNDTLGHAAGDRLLQEVAVRLRESLRASDAVARLGGDEFVALLPGIESPRDAEIAAEKLLRALREAFRVNDYEHGLSASIGIALCPDDGESPKHLLQRADAAMYSVKTQGRDGWKRFGPAADAPSRS